MTVDVSFAHYFCSSLSSLAFVSLSSVSLSVSTLALKCAHLFTDVGTVAVTEHGKVQEYGFEEDSSGQNVRRQTLSVRLSKISLCTFKLLFL